MKIIDALEIIPKVLGIIAAFAAILALLLPKSLWKPIEAQIASAYGQNGWVYYEVKNRAEKTGTTLDSNLVLMKKTNTAYYREIELGDKLRVSGNSRLRAEGKKDSEQLFILINGDCVIVTEEPSNEVQVTNADSGGWLEVATSPCGLY